MWYIIIAILAAWVILSVVGFVVQGLLWLGFIGLLLIVGTIVFGVLKQRAKRASS